MANDPKSVALLSDIASPEYPENPNYIYHVRERFRNDFWTLSGTFSNVHSVGFIEKNTNKYFFQGSISDISIYLITNFDKILNDDSKAEKWHRVDLLIANNEGVVINTKELFVYTQRINDRDFIQLGTFVLFVHVNDFSRLLKDRIFDEWVNVSAVDSDGNLVFSRYSNSNVLDMLPENFDYKKDASTIFHKEGVKYLAAVSYVPEMDWYIIGLSSLNEVRYSEYPLFFTTLIVLVFGITVCVMLTIVFSRRLTGPLKKIADGMIAVTQNGIERTRANTPVYGIYELDKIEDCFDSMVKAVQEHINREYKAKIDKEAAQYRALQAQINPHFLYNTLETINGLLILSGNSEASKLVVNLGELLRHSIRETGDLVTIESEVWQIERYLYIFKVRLGERLSYTIDLEPNLSCCLIPKFIIQPIVENAVIHGVEKVSYPVAIHICICTLEGDLVVTVSDNGFGIKDNFKAAISVTTSKDSNSIGISNVISRIHLLYGERYGLKIESIQSGGTKVTIRLPVNKPPKN